MFSLIVVVVDDMVVEVDNRYVENMMEVAVVVVDVDSVAAALDTVVDNVQWVVVGFRRRKA